MSSAFNQAVDKLCFRLQYFVLNSISLLMDSCAMSISFRMKSSLTLMPRFGRLFSSSFRLSHNSGWSIM